MLEELLRIVGGDEQGYGLLVSKLYQKVGGGLLILRSVVEANL